MKKELTEPRAWFTVDELNAWADKKLKENPQWAEKPAQQQEPVARVAEVHMSRYTLEWTNGPLPEGTALYSGPQPSEQEPVDTDWDAVHEKLIEVWNRQISADEGLDEIQDLTSTSPPAIKPWVGLELHEVRHLKFKSDQDWMATRDQELRPEWADVFARAIEAKLREKNAPQQSKEDA